MLLDIKLLTDYFFSNTSTQFMLVFVSWVRILV